MDVFRILVIRCTQDGNDNDDDEDEDDDEEEDDDDRCESNNNAHKTRQADHEPAGIDCAAKDYTR